MLKIIPITKVEEQIAICYRCGIEYDKNQFAYAAYQDEECVGGAQFFIKNEVGYISDLRVNDTEDLALSMLLGRSVLNFLDLHGIKEAYFEKSGEFYDKAAKLIGFKIKDGKHYAYLEGMFTVHDHNNK